MNQFSISCAVNNLSFGSVSIAILREMYKRGLTPSLFPIAPDPSHPFDLSAQKDDPDFTKWLIACASTAQQRHSRKNPTFRLWHINDSLGSYSEKGNNLLTFFELDQNTPSELNILRQQNKVYVTSKYTQTVFSMFGIQSTYLPLGFDSFNFHSLSVRPKIEGTIQYFMGGKFEARKSHPQVLRAWAKKYGNKQGYILNCAIHNPFLPPGAADQMIGQALEGKRYSNINFLPWSATNADYNVTLQSSDIVLCMSGGEGRDLPAFHATALGAWPVAMRAHAYLDYLDDSNAILVNPNGKRPAADGVFFHQNQQFNSGNLFTFSDDEFLAACDIAEAKARTGINKAGLALQNQSYAETVDILLKDL